MPRDPALTFHSNPFPSYTPRPPFAPFFCMMTQVTTYLKGLFMPVSFLMQFSRQLEVHWLTWSGSAQT